MNDGIHHVRPSQKLKAAVRLSETPQYKIAFAAAMHPDTLSKLLNGALRVRAMDPRLIAVGRILGVSPQDCFETVELEAAAR
jgi:hypothetical protein